MKQSEERKGGSGHLTVQEAGRKGGEATRRLHGSGFFRRIGRQGAERVKALIALGRESERASAQ